MRSVPRGGHLYILDIILFRVVFQDQAMYMHTSFRGEKNMHNWRKGCVFGHVHKFWKGHDEKLRKRACKKCVLRVFFSYLENTCLCSMYVFWKSFYKDDIQPEIQVPPVGLLLVWSPICGLPHAHSQIYSKDTNCSQIWHWPGGALGFEVGYHPL